MNLKLEITLQTGLCKTDAKGQGWRAKVKYNLFYRRQDGCDFFAGCIYAVLYKSILKNAAFYYLH